MGRFLLAVESSLGEPHMHLREIRDKLLGIFTQPGAWGGK